MPTGPFVGRSDELEIIGQQLESLADRRGFVLVLRGAAGIGKTRLIEHALADRPLVVGRAYADADRGAPPLWLWIRACSSAGLDDVARLLDASAGDPAATEVEATAAQFRLLAEATELLIARREPTVLVLEDLHWTDRATLDLLKAVAAACADSNLGVVASTRPADSRTEAQYGLAERYPATTVLEVGPLTVSDVTEYLDGDAASAERVHADSGGYPLLLAVGHGSTFDVRRIAMSMMAQVEPASREAVETAAIIGEHIDGQLLTAVVDAPIASALQTAARAGLLTEDGSRFTHALLRDAVAETAAPDRVRHVHTTAAERLIGSPIVSAARIASHLIAAADPRAAHWSKQAAGDALAAFAYDDAVRHLRDADTSLIAAHADPETIAENRLAIARAAYLAGHAVEALALCRIVSESTERADLAAAAALVVHGLAFEEADQANFSMVRRALAFEQPLAVRSRLLAQLAAAQANMNDLSTSEMTAAEAWATAIESGDAEARLEAAQARELTLLGPTDDAERLQIALATVESAEALGRPVAQAIAQGWRIRAAYADADVTQVHESLRDLTALAARTRLPLVQWHLLRSSVAVATLEGRFDDAERGNAEARSIADASGDAVGSALSDALLLHLALVRGSGEVAESVPRVVFDSPGIPLVALWRALHLFHVGDHDGSRQEYSRLRPALWNLDVDLTRGAVLFRVLDLAEAFDDRDAAEQVYLRLEPWQDLPGAVGTHTAFFTGPMSSLVGRALTTAGRAGDAEPWLRRAIGDSDLLRARPSAVSARCDLAAHLLRQGGSHRGREAQALLTEAKREAQRLGMPGSVKRAEELAALQPDPLSSREREIANLVVAAMTNRQIADRYVISERTVETHVRSILGKLGCTNRTELIARRAELGL